MDIDIRDIEMLRNILRNIGESHAYSCVLYLIFFN